MKKASKKIVDMYVGHTVELKDKNDGNTFLVTKKDLINVSDKTLAFGLNHPFVGTIDGNVIGTILHEVDSGLSDDDKLEAVLNNLGHTLEDEEIEQEKENG